MRSVRAVSGDALTLRGKRKSAGDALRVAACAQQSKEGRAGVKVPHPFRHDVRLQPQEAHLTCLRGRWNSLSR